MIELLAELLPLIAAAAANPAVIMIVIVVLSVGDRSVARATAFVAGFGVVLIALGVVGLFALRSARETVGPGGSLFAWIDIAIGAVMLVLAVAAVRRRAGSSSPIARLERVPAWGFAGVGAAFMITDTSALIAYVPMLRDIATSGLERGEQLATLAVADLLIALPIAAPLLIRVLAPAASERALGTVRRFLDRYGHLITAAVFAAIGAFLLIRGIGRA